MTKLRAFVTRRIHEKALQLVQEHCEVAVWPLDVPPTREELLRGMHGMDAVLALLTDRIDSDVMDAAPNLKVISNCAVGVDNVDLVEATRRRIPVGNTPDVLTDATADMALALLLAAARHVVEGADYVKAGKWKTWNLQLLLGADLAGATLGIIGFGRIGKAVAKRADGFGLRVIFHDPKIAADDAGRSVGLDFLLHESDFVSLHVPLTAATHHLINEKTLRQMKPSAVLINTSRGPVVDHQALFDALQSRRIFGAGLDVTEPEPINADSPLLGLDNCVVLPHLGSASLRTREQMALLAAKNLVAGVQGNRLPHCANPGVYE